MRTSFTHLKPFALSLTAPGACLRAGCRSIGPKTVARDRSDYSSSISESSERQTLLNIVKLRYLDPPVFVDVSYRGHWFWIDDRDLRSKRALAFMLMLFTLSDSGQKESLPLITIPAQ